jgi:hypothetical protein
VDVSTCTVAQLRQSVVSRIEALSGWWCAPVAYDAFNAGGVPEAVPALKAHLAFVVGTPSSSPVDMAERQKPAQGVWVQTDMRVRFLARYTPGPTKAVASIDAATAAELALIQQLLAVSPTWPATFKLVWASTPSRALIASGEWFLHEVAFNAYHRLPLT